MKKILIINTIGLGYEGISNVIFNYCYHMDKTDISISITAPYNAKEEVKERFRSIGNVIDVPRRSKHVIQYFRAIKRIMADNYDVVHIHGNSGTMLIEVMAAKMAGVKKIIVHGHNTTCNHPIVNKILKVPMIALSDCLMACSKAAGKFLYGKRKYIILNNAIDVKKYGYNEQMRIDCRKEFGIQDEYVIGHIGHFSEQKNHLFLVDVFSEYHKVNENSKLLLVGDGSLFQEVQQKVKELKLEDAVIFAGRRADAERLYQAMDVFVFPSLWEGFALAVVEAQAAGLYCFCSDVVPRETKLSSNIKYISIKERPFFWAERVMESDYGDREIMSYEAIRDIRKNGYDIQEKANELSKIYLKK